MSNRALWNVRKRHEWLTTTPKKRTMTRRGRLRVGLQEAIDRKKPSDTTSTVSS